MPLAAQLSGQFRARYQLVRLLGEGFSGEVFEAIQVPLKRRVAIKFLKAEHFADLENRVRFVREARLMARLAHANVVTLYDADIEGLSPYLAMEFVTGDSLARALERFEGHAPLPWVLQVARGLLCGLDYLHGLGVLHRDLKPQNILMEGDTPKLADFGMSLVQGGQRVTQEGIVVGTPMFMAPEQLTGGQLGPRADLYALGMTLFMMLAREFPKVDVSPLEHLRYKLAITPRVLASQLPEAPAAVVAFLSRCLAVEPERRFDSARAAIEALDGMSPSDDRVKTKAIAAPQVPRRRWKLAAAAGVALAGIVLAARPRAVDVAIVPAAPPSPARARVTSGARSAHLWLQAPLPAGSSLSLQKEGSPGEVRYPLPAGRRDCAIEGLEPATRYRAAIAAGDATTAAEFRTLETVPRSELTRLDADIHAHSIAAAASGDTVAVIWSSKNPAHPGLVRLRRSVDGGSTWGPLADLNPGGEATLAVAVESCQGGLWTAWLEGQPEQRAGSGAAGPSSKIGRAPGESGVGGSEFFAAGGQPEQRAMARWLPNDSEEFSAPLSVFGRWTGLALGRLDPDNMLVALEESVGPERFEIRRAVLAAGQTRAAEPMPHLPAARPGCLKSWLLQTPHGTALLNMCRAGDDRHAFFFAHPTPELIAWGPARQITGALPGIYAPSAASRDSRIGVAFASPDGVRVLVSEDGGNNFSQPAPVEDAGAFLTRPALLVTQAGWLLAAVRSSTPLPGFGASLALYSSPDGRRWRREQVAPLRDVSPSAVQLVACGQRVLAAMVDRFGGVLTMRLK